MMRLSISSLGNGPPLEYVRRPNIGRAGVDGGRENARRGGRGQEGATGGGRWRRVIGLRVWRARRDERRTMDEDMARQLTEREAGHEREGLWINDDQNFGAAFRLLGLGYDWGNHLH